MRKTFLLLALTAFFITGFYNSSSAQYSQWNFGFEGGVGNSALVGNDAIDLNTLPKFGFIAGLFGQYNINRYYSVKMSANYQVKGADLTINGQNIAGQSYSANGEIKLDYITIPLMFKASFGDYVKFFINGGPYLGILLTNETTLDANNSDSVRAGTYDRTDSTTSADFGISLGLGLQIPLSTSMGLTLEIRDDIGLTNISDYDPNPNLINYTGVTSSSTKNNSLNVMLGLTFNGGRKYSTGKK